MILENYKEIIKDLSINEYVFTEIEIKNDRYTHHINKKIKDSVFSSVIDFVNKSTLDNIVFICRHPKEWNITEHPTNSQIQIIKKRCSKTYKIFYQDPWPTKVPKFSSDNTIIRFGYDEGTKIDNLAGTWFTLDDMLIGEDYKNKVYYTLMNTNKIHEIHSEDISLI